MALQATELRVKTQADMDAENLFHTAHQKAGRARPADMAAFFQALLGQQLTAYMTGCADAKAVGKWARGERTPRGETLQKLRAAFHVATLLTGSTSQHRGAMELTNVNATDSPSMEVGRIIPPNYFIRGIATFSLESGQQWLDVRSPQTHVVLRRDLSPTFAHLGTEVDSFSAIFSPMTTK